MNIDDLLRDYIASKVSQAADGVFSLADELRNYGDSALYQIGWYRIREPKGWALGVMA